MKNILFGIGVVAAIALLFFAFLFGKNKGRAEGDRQYAELRRQFDSIAAIPPDTVIKRDTIRPDPVIHWRTDTVPVPVPVPGKPDLRFYADTMISEDLAIFINDTVRGFLLNRRVGYELYIPRKITETKTITEKVPVLVPTPTARNGVLLGAGIGGGNQFAWSLGAAYQKDRHQYGFEYLRFGNTNNWLVNYRYLIFVSK